MTQNLFIRLIAVLALMVHQGCAHTTGPILSESVQKDMRHIGIVVKEGEEESLQDSRRGWLSSMGAGAARGSMAGGAGVLCYGVAAAFCIPALATVGAVGGSVYGLYQASSETLPTEVESTLSEAITDAGLANLLVTDLVADAKAFGYAMEDAKNSPLVTGKKQEEESLALQAPFDILLLIEGPVVNLLPTTFEIDPPRRVGLSARVRVIRMADQEVLEDQIVLEELGDVHFLAAWADQKARHFREELPRASRRLSEKILIDFFMRYAFKERSFSPGANLFFDLYEVYRVRGLRALRYLEGLRKLRFMPDLVSSRPTMRWETFSGENVTYDFRIWESKEGSRTQVGEVVYSREGLRDNVHTVETSLSSYTTYNWSVRARFVQDGKVRVTEWSKATPGITVFGKISSFGVMALWDLAIEEWGFYQFRTTGAQEAVDEEKFDYAFTQKIPSQIVTITKQAPALQIKGMSIYVEPLKESKENKVPPLQKEVLSLLKRIFWTLDIRPQESPEGADFLFESERQERTINFRLFRRVQHWRNLECAGTIELQGYRHKGYAKRLGQELGQACTMY